MLRTIDDIVELRRWAECRGARPCRDEGSGRLGLAFPTQPCTARLVDWGEWEATFVLSRWVFVYEDAPGGVRFFVGPEPEAHAWVSAQMAAAGYGHRPSPA
jgi:hypothetical protein